VNFRTTVELNGKTATGMPVPTDVVESLGGGKRPAVSVTIGAYTYRTSIGSMGGRSMIPVSAEVREAAGVSAGDEVDVQVELDTAPREVAVPGDLAGKLAEDAVAKAAFEALSYSNKRRLVLAIESAKAPETRARRIAKTVADLHSTG